MSNRNVIIIAIVCLISGALIQRQWDGKQTEKIMTITRDIIHNQIVTVTKTITKPDGSTETDSTTTDTSIKKEIEKQIVESSKPFYNSQWLIAGGASLNSDREQFYKLEVQRNILGPLWLGIYGTTHKELGLSAGILF